MEKKTVGDRSQIYNLVMQNAQQIGKKTFASIPLSLLYVDSTFQRDSVSSLSKILNLASKWTPSKMNPLKVSPHPEDCSFSVIDGYHRFEALKVKGIESVACEVITGLSTDPKERIVQEARIFVTQNDEVERLTSMHKHKANLIRGVRENIVLQRTMEKYGVTFVYQYAGQQARANGLTGFSTALKIARYGESLLDKTFHVIFESGWNLTPYGFRRYAMDNISTVLMLHPVDAEKIIPVMIQYLRETGPEEFEMEAVKSYPKLSVGVQQILHLEDYVCDALGIKREYKKNDLTIIRHVVKTEAA